MLPTTFEPYVVKIEQDYVNMQETLLTAGMSGLNLAVIFHEVERGVRALHQVIVDGRDMEGSGRIKRRNSCGYLDGFSTLLRRDSKKQHRAHKLVAAAREFNYAAVSPSPYPVLLVPLLEDVSA